jgi:hypothetical protein
VDSTKSKIVGGVASLVTIAAASMPSAGADFSSQQSVSFAESSSVNVNRVDFTAAVHFDIKLPVSHFKWSNTKQKKYDFLLERLLVGSILAEEKQEFDLLEIIRERALPSRTFEEIMRAAEHDSLLKEMNKILQRYVQFTEGSNHPDHKAAWYPATA